MVERGGESLQVSLVNIESVATSFLFLVTSLGVSPPTCHVIHMVRGKESSKETRCRKPHPGMVVEQEGMNLLCKVIYGEG